MRKHKKPIRSRRYYPYSHTHSKLLPTGLLTVLVNVFLNHNHDSILKIRFKHQKQKLSKILWVNFDAYGHTNSRQEKS